jgi:hypothetical protein
MQQAADLADVTDKTQETGPMHRDAKNDLKVGERVVLIDYADGVVGEIAERLDENYVRVRWQDSFRTTHRTHALRRFFGVRDGETTGIAAWH